MGKLVTFEQVLAARFRKKEEAEKKLSQKERDELADKSGAVALEAAKREDALFLSSVDPGNPGIKILRGSPRFQFLQAVFDEKLDKYFTTKIQNHMQHSLNERSYWIFPDRPQRAYFVSPAHVCRTHLMAVALAKHVDFRQPDAEGHLPLYFLARYAKDRLVIPSLAAQFNMNANDSGRNPHTHQAYDAPLIRAIKYGNAYAVHGLEHLSPKRIDLNRRGALGLTPLMAAVLHAEDATTRQQAGKASAMEVAKRLWIVRFLAAAMHTDPSLTDPTGSKAADYAMSPRTREALKAGIAKKDAFIQRFMPKAP
jgi:hypothetical protein